MLIVEIVTYGVLLESQGKKITWREYLKRSIEDERLTTEHLHKTLFSLVNVGTIRASKTLQGNGSYYISNIDDFEALVELKNQSDNSKN